MDLRCNSLGESQLENEPVSSTPALEHSVPADSHGQEDTTSEVTSAGAQTGHGMLSDSGGDMHEAITDEGVVVEEERAVASPLTSSFRTGCQSGSASGENEQIGRPSSAPARTPSGGRSGPALLLPLVSPSRWLRPAFSNVPLGSYALRTDFVNSQENDPSSPDIQSSTVEIFERDLSPDMDTSTGSGDQPLDQEDFGLPYYRTTIDCNRPLFHCSYCSYSTPSLNNMRVHGNNHPEGKVMLRCNMCNFTTARKSYMKHHRRVQHRRPANPAPTIFCEKCQFSTSAPYKMREHYSRLHNGDNGTSIISTSMHMRAAAFNTTNPNSNRTSSFGSDRTMYVDANGHSRALHAFRLAQPRGTLQFETDPSSLSASVTTIPAGRVNPSYSPSLSGMLLRHDDQHITVPEREGRTVSSHFITNIMASPRVPVTSTVTSLEYPARPANPHRPDLNCLSPLRGSLSSGFRDSFTGPFTVSPNRGLRNSYMVREILNLNSQDQGDSAVKVKTEPIDCDGDVTSSGLISVFEFERGGIVGAPERPRRDALNPFAAHAQIRYRPYESVISRSIDQSDEIGPSVRDTSDAGSNDAIAGSNITTPTDRHTDHVDERETPVGRLHHLVALFKTETSSVGVQCSGSSALKSELPAPTVTVAAAEHSTGGPLGDSRQATEERGIQCELISSPPRSNRLNNPRVSTDSEQHSMSGFESRCSHCGITFEDEVLFTIHVGCHSHTDPFVCNVCGKKCGNKYGFYSHITRGHHL